MDNSQYFYRAVVFTRANNRVALADINQTDKITPLDEWMGTILSLADGEHSIQEMLNYMRARYSEPPENLEQTIHSVLERLINGKLIQLSDKPISLPYYLAAPIEELDINKAKKLIHEDGYDHIDNLIH